jgi:hypothetical protein
VNETLNIIVDLVFVVASNSRDSKDRGNRRHSCRAYALSMSDKRHHDLKRDKGDNDYLERMRDPKLRSIIQSASDL